MKKQIKEHGTPKDVFVHLLATVTVAMSVIAFTTIWFQVVNILFPDPLTYSYGSIDLIRGMIAATIVGWPIYLFLARIIKNDIVASPDKQNIRVRKWLMYLTLFVASIVLIINLVTLLTGFLGGELTTRFALKIVSVFIAAGGTFGYYLWDVKRDVTEKTQVPIATAVISTVLIIATLVVGFLQIGSPKTQRAIKLDNQRVDHLSQINYQLLASFQEKGSIPGTLDEVFAQAPWLATQTDPETKQNYEYRKLSETQFELCATFALSSDANKNIDSMIRPTPYKEYGFISTTDWTHSEGRNCFTRTLDPTVILK